MASSEVQAWIRRLPEPHSEGLSPPSIVYPESSYSSRTTRKLQDVVSSLPSPTPSPDIDGTSSTPRRRRLEENAATVRKRPRYEDQRTSDRRGIALPAKSSASPGRSRPKSSSARRSRGLNGARSNKTTISVSSSTMAQTASPPCEPRMSASSIEIGRGTRTARPSSAVETRSPGWSWLNPIDISSIPSSTSVWTSSSFARHRAPQQQQQRGESQDMSRVGVATSTITSREEANVTPPPNGEEAEVMPGRIVTSIEVEPFQEARPREVAQPRRREASGAKQQPMLATATTDPDQAQQDGEHREERPDALIPLPMVAMDGVNWYLLFVVPDGSSQLAGDTSDELTKSRGVKLTQPMRIGSTDSLVEIYKLLAILREIVNWVGRDFRSWFEGLL
ncbi:hypothetical protein JX265_004386 [Neoarthrinium moseri]|uniref:PD-(D/E)XK nuclease-like domain-containing protein n=1 Tax=Neoarthrinium moseri TaxID=1658444 RepID=A0A9P9WQW1_9PEZI|nr:hypothetical protein JX265_004386 [Neoarthrinium moseri]